MDILKYKGYEGSTEIDMERGVCRGKILFINDLVTYEAETPIKLKEEFEAAVDDYIETCNQLNRTPQKSLKGQFNVRISPELHRKAAMLAIEESISLNEVVSRALNEYLDDGNRGNGKSGSILDLEKQFSAIIKYWDAQENQVFNFARGSKISLKSDEEGMRYVNVH